mmetsp:Transcript_13876/g.46842  ORF Transcript_13876/g.46842 Transcript_13876/m.46842 type:complete len:216 (-) Transcript_13876:723-1370(-)
MYLTVAVLPFSRKKRTICFLTNSPMAGSLRLPEASTSADWPRSSSPAPSATTTTAWPCSSTRRMRCGSTPCSPSRMMGTSGTRHRSTSPDASVAWTAMKPEERPMSLTIPMPLGRLQRASVLAARMAACAASTLVWKPKLRSMRSTSLSMVFGMPATATLSCLLMHSSEMVKAPRWVPSPPTTKSCVTRSLSRKLMILSMSKEPREDARTVPPSW